RWRLPWLGKRWPGRDASLITCIAIAATTIVALPAPTPLLRRCCLRLRLLRTCAATFPGLGLRALAPARAAPGPAALAPPPAPSPPARAALGLAAPSATVAEPDAPPLAICLGFFSAMGQNLTARRPRPRVTSTWRAADRQSASACRLRYAMSPAVEASTSPAAGASSSAPTRSR